MLGNLSCEVCKVPCRCSLIFHTAKVRHSFCAAKFQHLNWGDFQHQFRRFLQRIDFQHDLLRFWTFHNFHKVHKWKIRHTPFAIFINQSLHVLIYNIYNIVLAFLSKRVVEFVESVDLWICGKFPFPQFPQSSQVENETNETYWFHYYLYYYQLH